MVHIIAYLMRGSINSVARATKGKGRLQGGPSH
jgi:hypothetical protein